MMNDFSGNKRTRRDFLKQSGLVLGAAAFSARSYAQAAGANNRLRAAIIGCGGIANMHRDALLKLRDEDNVEIVALTDVYRTRAERFQEMIKEAGGDPVVKDDYRQILDMSDVDLVVIATPEHSHAYITLDAIDAGKHIYCEKPLTHTIRESRKVVDAVNATDLKLQVGVQGMSDDSYPSALEAIRAGKLGTVVEAQIDYVRNYTEHGPWRRGVEDDKGKPDDLDWDAWLKPAPEVPWNPAHYFEWRCYSQYSGGVATDLFIHRLTRILRACDLKEPEYVVGMGGIYTWPDGRDLPDSFEMLAEYPAVEGVTNGMTVHVLGTMANDDGIDHCIRGTQATLGFTGEGWVIKDDASGDVIETHKKTGGEDATLHHKNHHAAIREGVPLNCPPELGMYGTIACRMANLSWFNKSMMRWDAKRGRARKA